MGDSLVNEGTTEQASSAAVAPGHRTVSLKTHGDQLSAFFPLLQRGVTVPVVAGCPLNGLLCEQFLIPEDYVTGRITTIFLDNRPIDDLKATIRDGARLTLSAAMPGLVGAVMRRSGFYAALRQGITHAESGADATAASATITLKLFNLLLPELGPLILARGILLQRSVLDELLKSLSGLWMASSHHSDGDAGERILLTVSFTE